MKHTSKGFKKGFLLVVVSNLTEELYEFYWFHNIGSFSVITVGESDGPDEDATEEFWKGKYLRIAIKGFSKKTALWMHSRWCC